MKRGRAAALALLLALLLALPAAADADRLAWLSPPRGPRAPFQVGLTLVDSSGKASLPGGARVSAQGGELAELPPQGPVRVFSLSPQNAEVSLSAACSGCEGGQAKVRIGAPANKVALKAEPAAPVKQRDTSARLEISVLREDGTPDPLAPLPVVRSNVGQIRDLHALGDGRFEATYQLPQEVYPEVAIVVAFTPWPSADSADGAFGVALVPLASAVNLPVRTEPNASFSLEIAGKTFGPMKADASGRLELPIVVPPGHRMGKSLVVDRLGNRRVKTIDLHLPPTDRIACVANPASLPGDGRARARVLCAATDPFGAPQDGARLNGSARLGKLEGPRALGSGAYEWSYLSPKTPGEAAEELRFEFPAGGPQSRESLPLSLTPLALKSAVLTVAEQPVFAGTTQPALLVTTDPDGRPAPALPALSAARGALSAFEQEGPGRLRATYTAPAQVPPDWTDIVSGTVLDPPGKVPARLEVSAVEKNLVARVTALNGRPISGEDLEIRATDAALGLATKTESLGLATFALPPPTGADKPIEILLRSRPTLSALVWRLETSQGTVTFPEQGPFEPAAVQLKVALAPATPVDVRLEVAGRTVRCQVLDAQGRVLRGREVAVEVARADGTPVTLGPPQPQSDGSIAFLVNGGTSGRVSVSAIDVASGVSASQEAVLP